MNVKTPGQRIVIVGTTGCGKSTLAQTLAAMLTLPHTELDALYWGPGWQETLLPIFRERVDTVTEGDRWVIDGNYSAVRDVLWSRADTLIWLDYTLAVIIVRLLGRTLHRTLLRQTLWNGNRERLWEQFFTRDSLLWYAARTHQQRRQTYERILEHGTFTHLNVFRFRSPSVTQRWLSSIAHPQA